MGAEPFRIADEVRTTVEAAGAGLEVSLYAGDAQASTIVFLHEGLGSVAMWRDFPGRVAAATGCPVMVYSRRGYGRSAPRTESYDVDFMHYEALEVLPELLSSLAIKNPILFGHSDGGSIALIHAAAHSVAGVIVMAPHIFVELMGVASIAELCETVGDTDFFTRLGRYHDDPQHAFRGWNNIWLAPEFRAWNIEKEVSLITAPVLAIQGVSDQYGTIAQINGIAAGASGPVELLKLPDCGHSPHRDQTESVLEAARTFINGLGRPRMGEKLGNGRYLEDYAEGEVIISRSYKISKREIMTYAEAYDPQPIHIDENYASRGPFGDIIASGFQTISLAFRLFVETGYFDDGVSMGGPGMDEVRWLVPVYPGDVLTNHITVLETRPSKSKSDRGILRLGHELRNHKGETCTTGSTVTIVKIRPAG